VSEVATGQLGTRELLVMISAIMALMAVGTDLLLPTFDDMRREFGMAPNSNAPSQTITVFFLGLALPQIIYGPFADRFGRKPTLYTGLSLYVLGALGAALAPTFQLMLVSRFVWGLGAAGARVVATAIVRDNFVDEAMAKAMSKIMAVFILVPVFAPALGAGIIAVLPWRGVFWVCIAWTIGIFLWTLRLPETLKAEHVRPLTLTNTLRGIRQVGRTPVTVGYTVASMFLQGVFTTYLASSELIIGDILGRGAQFPFVFGSVAILFGIASLINGRIVGIVGLSNVINRASIVLVVMSMVLLAVALGSGGKPNFWIYMPLLGLTFSTFMFLVPNLNTAALGPVGEIAGTASAVTGAARIASGAIIGTILSSFITVSIIPFAVGMAALCSLSTLTVAVVRHRTANRLVVGAALTS